MAFDGNEGEWITLDDAKKMAEKFRKNIPMNEKHGTFLGINKIRDILNQSDCKGLRLYFGRNDSDELTIVMVGADSQEKDLTSKIMNVGKPCPSACGSI